MKKRRERNPKNKKNEKRSFPTPPPYPIFQSSGLFNLGDRSKAKHKQTQR